MLVKNCLCDRFKQNWNQADALNIKELRYIAGKAKTTKSNFPIKYIYRFQQLVKSIFGKSDYQFYMKEANATYKQKFSFLKDKDIKIISKCVLDMCIKENQVRLDNPNFTETKVNLEVNKIIDEAEKSFSIIKLYLKPRHQ